MNEMQLNLIRQGKCPIQFDADGKPLVAHYPVPDLMRFICAMADGYMKLYNSKILREKMERSRRRELER